MRHISFFSMCEKEILLLKGVNNVVNGDIVFVRMVFVCSLVSIPITIFIIIVVVVLELRKKRHEARKKHSRELVEANMEDGSEDEEN